MTRTTKILLFLVLALAAVLRFTALGSLPHGVWLDEALKGLEGIASVHTGYYQIFYPANSGREGPWIWMLGWSESVFGVNQFGLRFWSAFFGTLTVLFIFLFAREYFGTRVALLAAFFTATGFWHLLFSRLAFRAILVPFLLLSSLYLLRCAEKRIVPGTPEPTPPGGRAWLVLLLSALLFGFGFYTYLAFRVTPLLVGAWFLFQLWQRKRKQLPTQPWLRMVTSWLVVVFFVALPMGLYLLHHPQDLVTHSKKVSILSDPTPARVVWRESLRTAGMFNFHGDKNWRHNVQGKPELGLFLGIFFLAGLGLAIYRICRRHANSDGYMLLLLWFGVMLLPEVLTVENIPHSLRALGAVPAVYMFAALGAEMFLRLGRSRTWFEFTAIAIIVGAGGWEAYHYFHDWSHNPALIATQSFNQRQMEIGNYFNSLPAETKRIVVTGGAPEKLDRPELLHPPENVKYWVRPDSWSLQFFTYGHPEPMFLFTDQLYTKDDLRGTLPPGSVVVTLKDEPTILPEIEKRNVGCRMETVESFEVCHVPGADSPVRPATQIWR